MFLAELAKVLLRRWYLVVLSVGLAGGVGGSLVQVVPPTYSAEAEVLLLPPASTVGTDGNPYLSLGGLTPAGDVLAKALSDPTTATRLRPQGATADYLVELDGDTPAPLVMVTVTGSSTAETMKTLDVVLGAIPGTLSEVQRAANVPANAFITSTPITRDKVPSTSIKPMLRAVIVASGGVLVLCLLLTAAVDALLRRPRRRSAARADEQADQRDPAAAPAEDADAVASERAAHKAAGKGSDMVQGRDASSTPIDPDDDLDPRLDSDGARRDEALPATTSS